MMSFKNYLKKFKTIDLALFIVVISFLFAYLGISYYNRAMQDDFGMYKRTKAFGIITSVVQDYTHFEGAFVWYLWLHITAALNQYSDHIFFINLMDIIVLGISLFLMMTRIIKNLLPSYSVRVPLYLCILTISSSFYFRNDIIQQSVFWLAGSGYMTLMSLLFLGIYFLLKEGALNLTGSAFMLFLFAMVRIHYSLIELGILFYFLVWLYLENRKINFRIILVMLFALAGLALYLAAPGNYVGRFNDLTQTQPLHVPMIAYVKQFFLSLACYGYIHVLKSVPFLLLSFSLAFMTGLWDKKNDVPEKKFLSFVKFSVYTISISWVSLALVMTAIFMNHGNTRTFYFPFFIMVLLLNINFYLLGIRLRQKLQLLEHLAIPVALTACSLFIYFFLSDIGNLKQMNQQLDMRIVAIGQAKNSLTSKDTLFLPVLPYTKTLMSNELRGGVYLQWDEEAFKKYYETAFQIKIVPTKQ